MSIFSKFDRFAERFERARQIGMNPVGITFDDILSPTRARIGGKEYILAGTNNYLGLTFDETCIKASKAAIDKHGTATTGSRQMNGTYAIHVELENALKEFYGKPSAIVFSTGYQTNLAAISALAGPEDQVLIDADSHACIYDACRLTQATTIRFRHNNPADLDKRLERLKGSEGSKLVVVESMYSMFGDIAPLDEFTEVAHRHGAYIFVDEAHSVGSFGAGGRGLAEQQGVLDKIDFLSGTFSKSFASIGGFCVSNHPQFELVRTAGRAYMFTASPSPSNIASARAALDAICNRPELRENLWARARQLHSGLADLGFEICADASPVIAVRRPDEVTTVRDWNKLMASGVYVNVAVPPATPSATNLLRLSVSAAHSVEEIEAILKAFATLIPSKVSSTATAHAETAQHTL